jgi:hypothetical protein
MALTSREAQASSIAGVMSTGVSYQGVISADQDARKGGLKESSRHRLDLGPSRGLTSSY